MVLLGRAIYQHRLIAGLSMSEAARRAGVSLSSWSQYERGNPRSKVLSRCAQALGVSVKDLLETHRQFNNPKK